MEHLANHLQLISCPTYWWKQPGTPLCPSSFTSAGTILLASCKTPRPMINRSVASSCFCSCGCSCSSQVPFHILLSYVSVPVKRPVFLRLYYGCSASPSAGKSLRTSAILLSFTNYSLTASESFITTFPPSGLSCTMSPRQHT